MAVGNTYGGRVPPQKIRAVPRPRTEQDKNPAAERTPGLRERKKARLRQQIIDTAIELFRKHGYEETRIDDITGVLEISQPTFFRYFPTKSAVLIDFALEGIARITDEVKSELAGDATTTERLRSFFGRRAQRLEADETLWRAVVLSGAMDPVVSPKVRAGDAEMTDVLKEILARGQERGEVTRDFPVLNLAQAIDGLYKVMVWKWAGDITGRHSFADRVGIAVEIYLRGIKP